MTRPKFEHTKDGLIHCPECDWTDTSTGDVASDAMLAAAHGAEEHMSEADQRRAERHAADPDGWYRE